MISLRCEAPIFFDFFGFADFKQPSPLSAMHGSEWLMATFELAVRLSFHRSISLSACSPIGRSSAHVFHLSVHASVHHSICPFRYPSIPAHPPARPPARPPGWAEILLPSCLSAHLPVCLPFPACHDFTWRGPDSV